MKLRFQLGNSTDFDTHAALDLNRSKMEVASFSRLSKVSGSSAFIQSRPFSLSRLSVTNQAS
jgi:hypothetical protein